MPLRDNVPAERNEEEVQENNWSRHNSVTAAVSKEQLNHIALTEVEKRRHFQTESQSTASHLLARTRSFHFPTFIRPGSHHSLLALLACCFSLSSFWLANCSPQRLGKGCVEEAELFIHVCWDGRYTQGVRFLAKMVYKTVRGWTSGRNLPV